MSKRFRRLFLEARINSYIKNKKVMSKNRKIFRTKRENKLIISSQNITRDLKKLNFKNIKPFRIREILEDDCN